MPTVSIELFAGRSHAQKIALANSVTRAVVESLQVAAEKVQVKIYEMPAWHVAQGGVLHAEPPTGALDEVSTDTCPS